MHGGWDCYAIAQTNRTAIKLAKEFIADLSEKDCRKEHEFVALYACFFSPVYK